MKLTAALLATFVAGAFAECHNGCSGHGKWCTIHRAPTHRCGVTTRDWPRRRASRSRSFSPSPSPTHAIDSTGSCTNYQTMYEVATDTTQSNQLTAATLSTFGYDVDVEKKDSCTCFAKMEDGNQVFAFQAADCSQMTCPHGQSWDAAPTATNSHNTYAECSDRGICNRKTGTCACFSGYDGKGCRRTTCPNDCSSHGVCRTIHELTKLMSENTAWDSLSGFNQADIKYDTAWDRDRIRGCDCDAGFRGADCSIKEAPSNADPLGGKGSEFGMVCSGRGYNDGNGECVCFKGFFGTSCSAQRANVM